MNSKETNNLWLFLEVLAKRRNLILTLVILATLISVAVSFILPKWYKAQALLLPPKNVTTTLEGYNNMAEAFSITTGLNLPVMATPTDVYARMLTSRSVTESVIDKMNLKEHYKSAIMDETIEALLYYTTIEVTEEGLLRIAVEDKDPQKAADIANAMVDELDLQNRAIIDNRIQQAKEFIDERLAQVKLELDSARSFLEEFQLQNRTIDFDQQTRLAIEQAIELKVRLAELDTEIGMSEFSLGKDNPQLVDLKKQRSVIQGQLNSLETTNSDSSFFSLPVAEIPSLKGHYEILYSKVKVSEALYKVLLEQSEKTKIREYEKMPTITVLDRAKPPQLKSRPQKSYIVLGTFAVSLIFAIFLALFVDYLGRIKETSPDDYNRIMSFMVAYFGWLPGVKKQN